MTPDFLDTLNLGGPEHTSLLGTVTALYDVGCFFGAVCVFKLLRFWSSWLPNLHILGTRTAFLFQESFLYLEYSILTDSSNAEPPSLSVKDWVEKSLSWWAQRS